MLGCVKYHKFSQISRSGCWSVCRFCRNRTINFSQIQKLVQKLLQHLSSRPAVFYMQRHQRYESHGQTSCVNSLVHATYLAFALIVLLVASCITLSFSEILFECRIQAVRVPGAVGRERRRRKRRRGEPAQVSGIRRRE